MNRRLGPSATRVERQLERAARAIDGVIGIRPVLPARGPGPAGEPFWEVADDHLAYALRPDDPTVELIWRWTTDSPGTLAFWIVRDATFRMATSREAWADLIGAADPQWRTRHEAWLAVSDASGFVDWPNPAKVLMVIDRIAADLTAKAGQRHSVLPGMRARDDAQPWVETHGDELNYRVRSGDRDLRDDRTTDIDEFLFWVFEPVTREMARSSTGPGDDWRGRWLELMTLVNPSWRTRVEAYL